MVFAHHSSSHQHIAVRLRGNSQPLASPEEEKRTLVCTSNVHIFWRAASETDFYLSESQCWKERVPGTKVTFWASTHSLTIVPPPCSIQNKQEKMTNSQLLSGMGKSWSMCPAFWLFRRLPEEWVSVPQIWSSDRNWQTLEAWRLLREKEQGGFQQLQRTCSTIDRHEKEEQITSSWKEAPANYSNWQFTCTHTHTHTPKGASTEKVQEVSIISSQADWWRSFPTWSQSINWEVVIFFKYADPNTITRHTKKQENMAHSKGVYIYPKINSKKTVYE